MQIVIEIPDEKLSEKQTIIDIELGCIDGKICSCTYQYTPLPKGHGDLIDADALMKYCQNDINKTVDCNDISRFPTIIRREE